MLRTGKEIVKGLGQAAAQAGFDKMIKGGSGGPVIKTPPPAARPMPVPAPRPAAKAPAPKMPGPFKSKP
jgi:hypothetical protein